MTVTVESLQAGPFTATGLEQELPFEFLVFSDEEIEVALVDGTIVDPDDYTVDPDTDVVGDHVEGGSVTLLAGAVASGEAVYVRAKPAFDQGQVWDNEGSRLDNLNEALDRGSLRSLWLKRETTRALKLPIGEDAGDGPTLAELEGKALGFADGRMTPLNNGSAGAAAAAAYAQNALQSAGQSAGSATAAQTAASSAQLDADRAEQARIESIIAALASLFYPAADEDVPRGIVGHGAITPGASGTDGTYPLIVTGGNFDVNPGGTYTVSGNALTAVDLEVDGVNNPGLYIGAAPVAPTIDFTASGLIGAAAPLTVGFLRGDGEYYITDDPARPLSHAAVYQNVGGVATPSSPLVTFMKDLDSSFGGNVVGGFLFSNSAEPGDVEWDDAERLSRQPVSATDLTDETKYRFLISTALTNPTIRITPSVVSGRRRVTFNVAAAFLAVAFNGERVTPGYVAKGKAKPITTNGTFANWGVGLSFQSTAPTLGAAVGNMDAGAVSILYRANTGVVAVQPDAFTAAPGVTLGTIVAPLGWVDGEEIEPVFNPTKADGTEGIMRWLVDGIERVSTTVAGLPANAYWGLAVRNTNVGDVVELIDQKVHAPSPDVPLRLYVDPNGADGGAGTRLSPFNSDRDIATALAVDTERKVIEIIFEDGVMTDFSLNLDLTGRSRLSLKVAKGKNCKLRASQTINVGGAWELVSGNVWRIANPGRPLNLRGLIEEGRTQTWGLNGEYSSEDYVYRSPGLNTAADDLLPGEASSHISGTHDGWMLVRMVGDGNPADSVWRICSKSAPLVLRAVNGLYRAPTIDIIGFDLEDGFNYGAQITGCNLGQVENNIARYIPSGFGLDFQDCDGVARNSGAYACGADVIHMNDTLFTDPEAHLPCVTFVDCFGYGAGYEVVAGLQGDIFSNHLGNRAKLIRLKGGSAGKDIISTAGDIDIIDCEGTDAYNAGVSQASYPGVSNSVRVWGGRFARNTVGITMNGGGAGAATMEMDAQGVWLEDNVEAHIRTEQRSDPTVMIVEGRGLHYHNSSGVEPVDGNEDRQTGTTLVVRGATTSSGGWTN